MTTRRALLLVALLPLLASCGAVAPEAQDPGIDGTLVMGRADLHAVLGATATGDIVVVTNDGTVLALDTASSFAPTAIGTYGGQLGHDLDVEIAGGAVLVWRDRGHGAWDLDAWSRTSGRLAVATGLAPKTSHGVTSGTPDGQRIVFATGGVFTDGVGSDVVYFGVTLAAAGKPVQLARIPAAAAPIIELTLAGNRVLLKRYSDAALAGDLAKRGWPESQEPWEALWYDEDWQPLRSIAHHEEIALGDTALRVATNGADGELAIESLDGSAPIQVAQGCRFAGAFFLPGDESLVYSCGGAAYRFDVATGARTALGGGMADAHRLQCGDAACHDWVGGPDHSVVAIDGGAPLAGPEADTLETVHGDISGRLSPDGRFATASTDTGGISLVEIGRLDHRIVVEPSGGVLTWLDGARFTVVTTTETNKHYEDASSSVAWRDPERAGAGAGRVVARDVYSPFARASERALYAISKSPVRAPGLYRYALPE
jgi:hypothetical protein